MSEIWTMRKPLQTLGRAIEPNALLVHDEALNGTPSLDALAFGSGRIMLDSAAAPSAHPTREPVARAQIVRKPEK